MQINKYGFQKPDYSDMAGIPTLVNANVDVEEKILDAIIDRLNGLDQTVILFYDWDDTLIGALAVPKDTDCREAVNEYVKNNMIHPDLREQSTEQRASLERADSYRGEYPYTGPDEDDPLRTGGENTVEDGAEYPLTNHLEYVFYGKDIDPDYPYINGWAVVDKDNMEETFTALTAYASGNTPEAAGLTMADFSNLSGGGVKPE